jgi:hypothetical protein
LVSPLTRPCPALLFGWFLYVSPTAPRLMRGERLLDWRNGMHELAVVPPSLDKKVLMLRAL